MNSTKDLTDEVSWTSSSPAVQLNLSSRGQATAVSEGTAVISASLGEISAQVTIAVGLGNVTKLYIVPDSKPNRVGVLQQFSALGVFESGKMADVTRSVVWTSSVSSVAAVDSVSNVGLASLDTAGTTVITAGIGSVTASRTLIVDPATLTSIQINPSNLRVASGFKTALSATGIFSDGVSTDLTSAVTWSSASPSVASVSNTFGSKGIVTGVASGASSISASIRGLSSTAVVTVNTATLTRLDVSPSTLQLVTGGRNRFRADGTFSDASKLDISVSVTWSSSGTELFVSNIGLEKGSATAQSEGTNTVTALQNGIAGTATVSINDSALQSIAVTPSTSSIGAGELMQFKAMGTFSDTSTRDITDWVNWTSSDNMVAVVSNGDGQNAGLALGSGEGTTTVKAELSGVSGSGTLSVTASASPVLRSMAVTPVASVITVGGQQQFQATGIYSDGSVVDLSASAMWATGDGTILRSDGQGQVTALAAGSTTITASSGAVKASRNVTISPSQSAPPTPISLSGQAFSGTEISFTWASGGGSTASYRYSYVQGAMANTSCTQSTSGVVTNTSVVLSGLSAATNYTFIVCALNSNSTPLSSAPIAGVTVQTLANGTVATPTFSVAAGTYTSTQSVTLSSSTAGANMYYTTDGSTPTTSSTQYSTAISVSASQTVKAIAVKSTWADSSVASAAYVILPGTFTISSATSGSGQSVVTWGASSNAASYTLKYGTTSGSYPTTVSTSATSPYTVTGLSNATTYYFMVTAVNASGSTNASAEISATTKPAAPVISAVADSSSQITVSWSVVSGDSGGYKIAYQSGSSAPANCDSGTTTTAAQGATSKAITSLSASTQYTFIACTVNSTSGQSTASSSATATTSGSSSSATFTSGSGSFTVPAGVTSMTIELWGGGGGGGGGGAGTRGGGDGGGGGAYCKKTIAVSGGSLTYSVGASGSAGVGAGANGGTGGTSSATYSASTFSAPGGIGGNTAPHTGAAASGTGGVASGCDENRTGGTGSARVGTDGGGGGSSGASGSAGVTATATSTGATAPSGGGSGGNGGSGAVGSAGSGPGGGGGAGGKSDMNGGDGGSGQIKFTW